MLIPSRWPFSQGAGNCSLLSCIWLKCRSNTVLLLASTLHHFLLVFLSLAHTLVKDRFNELPLITPFDCALWSLPGDWLVETPVFGFSSTAFFSSTFPNAVIIVLERLEITLSQSHHLFCGLLWFSCTKDSPCSTGYQSFWGGNAN